MAVRRRGRVLCVLMMMMHIVLMLMKLALSLFLVLIVFRLAFENSIKLVFVSNKKKKE